MENTCAVCLPGATLWTKRWKQGRFFPHSRKSYLRQSQLSWKSAPLSCTTIPDQYSFQTALTMSQPIKISLTEEPANKR
ncbi:hypothetical protein CHARACLAT_010455 [Characodon lateralis]|uniref:Uncharacterized protein n=1 Tax=Characodon lateralis TaxID=208331 RepID=A0ABU7E3G9_9TELE|nr:hypothetical protein [Characodon lateralis]